MSGSIGPGSPPRTQTGSDLQQPGWHQNVPRPDAGPHGTSANPDTDAEPVSSLTDDVTASADQES